MPYKQAVIYFMSGTGNTLGQQNLQLNMQGKGERMCSSVG